MKKAILLFIDFYQRAISPLKGPTCRFYPTCSEYTKQAVIKYGWIKGLVIGIIRISKCHPFNKGGYDPLR